MRPLRSRLAFDVHAMYLVNRPPTVLATSFLKALAQTIKLQSQLPHSGGL
jgi:hypothetical protein